MIMMDVEHERVHPEARSVLIRQLPLEWVREDRDWTACDRSGEPPANKMLDVPAELVFRGKPRSHPFYGWDNELGEPKTEVPQHR